MARTIGIVQQPPPAPVKERRWVGRHPVLTGVLVGLGAGFAVGAATCYEPTAEGFACYNGSFDPPARLLGGFTLAGFGAGIGAGVGAIVRAIR